MNVAGVVGGARTGAEGGVGDMTGLDGMDWKRVEEAWLRAAERTEERAARYERLSEQIEAISVTESSELASVTVDVSGAITELTLVENLGGKRGSQVAAVVMSVMRRAQMRLTERTATAAGATVGPQDRVGAGLTERMRARFGEPPGRAPDTTASSAGRATDRDEDFGYETIMRRNR
jgi:hypothetical protein